jgi:phenylpropionate dioxygenase-like ring-hydroxylating dioxygenase large terminal subunit
MHNSPAHVVLARRLVEDRGTADRAIGQLDVDRYTSRARFERERAAIFARTPVIAAHESDLAGPGACLAVDVAGVSILLVRGDDGALRAFRNACRHRSTQLVPEGAPCRKKAIVCPYHSWTYDLRGTLVHVPHEAAFRGAQATRASLVAAHVASACGFVWASLEPFDVAAHTAGIAEELTAAARGVVYRRSVREVRGNWKLVIDAFLDGYHIRHLHRDTVGRFFVDARYEAERVGDHVRAATARRALLEADAGAIEVRDVRELVTPSYLVFPNAILVLHPDYTSVMTATPLGENRTRFTHTMLVAEAPRSEIESQHWEKSFALVDEGVFTAEDLVIVEAMQRGIESRANETVLVGDLEHAILWFHESVDRRLGD